VRLPVPVGGVKATLTDVVLNMVVAPMVGAFVCVITSVDEFDTLDVPPELVAVTLNI
jgi:hypothetical protein